MMRRVPPGTDVREYLLGERAPKLKLGYVAVVNRSQMDIKQNVSIKDALEGEQRWFQRSKAGGAAYRDIAHTSCGTRVLAHRINGLLKSHIQRMIPSLTSTLRHQVTCKVLLYLTQMPFYCLNTSRSANSKRAALLTA